MAEFRSDAISISQEAGRPLGGLKVGTRFVIRKFLDGQVLPYEVVEFGGNVGLQPGIREMWDLAASLGSPTNYGNANARVGVGDGTSGENPLQSGLTGTLASNAYAGMDVGYPARSNQQVSWRGTFGGAAANIAWQELVIDNGATPNKALIRKVSAQGTKTSGQSWELTATIIMS